ncbi:MAG: hypothetical protein COW08_02825 [Ignavibacteriales bacterium CG12_big_fil_rev_8_21_14_0_65_30_8]|nr:MAG: hypothetical protein COW08_02825 [Ignavibacteriales bacterium CG12_big_fil_rev_8_21_14_0_65_30_8]
MDVKIKQLLFFLSLIIVYFLFFCSSSINSSLFLSLAFIVFCVTSNEANVNLRRKNIFIQISFSLSKTSKQINSFNLIANYNTIIFYSTKQYLTGFT